MAALFRRPWWRRTLQELPCSSPAGSEGFTAERKTVRDLHLFMRTNHCGVHTHPVKPGAHLNLTLRIPDDEYSGISSKVLENTGISAYFWCNFFYLFIFQQIIDGKQYLNAP